MSWQGTKTFEKTSPYSFKDFNRVGINILHIYDSMRNKGFNVTLPYDVVPASTRLTFPTVSLINRMRLNVKALVDAFPEVKQIIENTGLYVGTFYSGERGLEYGTSDVPTIVAYPQMVQVFDYIEANKIEMTLQLLYDHLQ